MRYHIKRIRLACDGIVSFKPCNIIVSDLEDFRKSLKGTANFVYDIID